MNILKKAIPAAVLVAALGAKIWDEVCWIKDVQSPFRSRSARRYY